MRGLRCSGVGEQGKRKEKKDRYRYVDIHTYTLRAFTPVDYASSSICICTRMYSWMTWKQRSDSGGTVGPVRGMKEERRCWGTGTSKLLWFVHVKKLFYWYHHFPQVLGWQRIIPIPRFLDMYGGTRLQSLYLRSWGRTHDVSSNKQQNNNI